MTTLILAHPWHGSFNKAILDQAVKELQAQKKAYQIIDLIKDGFDPVMREEDLILFSKGQYHDPLVEKYQDSLKKSTELVFIFPIWWFDMPAVLKGFLDKVMLKNFAYTESSLGLKGLLTHIEKTTLYTTSESPNWYLRFFAGNPIGGTLIKRTLKGVGLKKVKWYNLDYITSGKAEKRHNYLNKISL